MIVAEPAATAVTTPVELFTEAIEAFVLDQAPPVNVFDKVEVVPTFVDTVPVILGITPATKLDVVPVLAIFVKVPVKLLFPLSIKVVIEVFVPLTIP